MTRAVLGGGRLHRAQARPGHRDGDPDRDPRGRPLHGRLQFLKRRPSTMLENVQVATLGATAGIVVGGSVFVMPAIFVLSSRRARASRRSSSCRSSGAVLGRHLPDPVPPLLRGRDARQAAVPRGHRDHRDPGHRREGRPGRPACCIGSMGIGFVLDYLAAGMEAWRDTFTTALIPACDTLTDQAQGGLRPQHLGGGDGARLHHRRALRRHHLRRLGAVVLGAGAARRPHRRAGARAGCFPGCRRWPGWTPRAIFGSYVRLIGIGGIFAAGLISILKMSPVIVQALAHRPGRAAGASARAAPGVEAARTERDIPMGLVAVLTAVAGDRHRAVLPLRGAGRHAGRDLARRSSRSG